MWDRSQDAVPRVVTQKAERVGQDFVWAGEQAESRDSFSFLLVTQKAA